MSARLSALEILAAVVQKHQYANLLLRHQLADLNDADKRLTTQIVYGTIQNYRYLRFQYQDYVQHKMNVRLKIIIDMSIYQLFFLDKVPPYAIVNEAVNLAKPYHGEKVVNGILRNVIARGEIKSSDIGIIYSFPEWIVELFSSQYGEEATKKIFAASNKASKVSLRYNQLKTTKELLAKDPLFEFVRDTDQLYYRGNIITTDYWKNGQVVIQDGSSQFVALTVNPQAGEKILDACAAPGTKTTHMASIMANNGEIVALDIHPHRLELLKQAMKKTGATCIVPLLIDAKDIAQHYSNEYFDKILVDAPCSGLGVLRRKPEIKLFLTPKAIDQLEIVQMDILLGVAKLLRIGGKLIYSTCTLNQKENQKLMRKFIVAHPDYQLISEKVIFPYEGDDDGFYIATLIRN